MTCAEIVFRHVIDCIVSVLDCIKHVLMYWQVVG